VQPVPRDADAAQRDLLFYVLRDREVFPNRAGKKFYCCPKCTSKLYECVSSKIFRYIDNANGSMRDIAGVLNRERNVMGLMPHPERATEPLMGSTDGLLVFQSMLRAAVTA